MSTEKKIYMSTDYTGEAIAPHQQFVTDADGKALWEDRLAYAETKEVVILPETTVEWEYPDSPEALLTTPFQKRMEGGNEYTITWNGQQHKCIAQEVDDGEGGVAVTVEAEGYFMIIQLPEQATASYGAYALVHRQDEITSATFSITTVTETVKTIDPKFLPGDGAGGGNGGSVAVDTTLSVSGAAADAKATGDAITALNEEIAVFGSTPQMYGAVGDGVTDDTAAIRRCFEAGCNIIMNGTYLISYDGVIDAPNVRTVRGNAKIILASGATANNSVLFKLVNATLFEGVEFDLNAQNMGFVIFAGDSEVDFTIRNCKMYNLRDDITTSTSCLVHIARQAHVVVDNLSFNNILKNGNDIIADGEGAHNCIYCTNYKSGSFTNLTFRDVHSSKDVSNFYIEDGSGLYLNNANRDCSTYIANITGHNCCKRTIKTQCAGMVIVNGAHIFYDVDDLIAGIGINNIENGSTELGKCIIMGVTGINRTSNVSTGNGFAGIIAVSDEGVITDCYFECPNTYAILPGHKTKVSNCKFVGNGVFVPFREGVNVDLNIEDCEHVRPQDLGWLVFSIANTQGAIKVKDCIIRITDDSTIANDYVYTYYPINASSGCRLTVDNVSFFNAKDGEGTCAIMATDDDTVIRNVYIQRPKKDSVYINGTGSLVINGMTMSEFELVDTRAMSIDIEGEVVLRDLKAEGILNGKYFVIPKNCTIVDTNLPIEYPYILFGSNVTVQSNTPVERKDLTVPSTLKNIKDGSNVYTLYKGQKYLYDKATDKWALCGAEWIPLISPNGTVYKLTIGNDGTVSANMA